MSEERTLLTQTVRDLVAKHAGPEAVRAAMDSARGYDEALWTMLCEQVGVAALVVPEEHGGAGGELADAAAVMAELGRNLVPTPLLGTTLAELALLASEDPDADALEQLAAGAVIGAVVFDPDYVLNGDTAEIVVAANDGELQRWTSFDTDALSTMDPTRRLAKVQATDTVALGTDPGLADIALLLLAAEQIGAATRALELTVEYTKERVQFGRPIGSFQALKHRMADLYVKVQTAGAVVDEAIADPSATSAALAHVMATEAFRDVVGEAIQLHGGIAITAEHDIQLYFKRAHGSSHLLVTPAEALRTLETEVFASAAAHT
ncbi:acyl-CoA dehydrogenase IpdE2 [Mycolicibacterium komossense]|uniref:Acyl-CoA/acyl-ACP dehydrogenase n=1 Tax=Mycolicibacterium komossense TaxID=1779 RepID=A0ABT3CJK5_9MYCO|nr:acyl-CoA dehydrogenase family protein [Mycolicibacterium komossense]MCV7229673.1 acyl-CoA/acyl-ACP dehydrogenase [Mycolicibacterium komossense]